jgi:hypothetical protein
MYLGTSKIGANLSIMSLATKAMEGIMAMRAVHTL